MKQSVRKLLEATLFLELFISFYTKVMIAWYTTFASTNNNYRVFTVRGKTINCQKIAYLTYKN